MTLSKINYENCIFRSCAASYSTIITDLFYLVQFKLHKIYLNKEKNATNIVVSIHALFKSDRGSVSETLFNDALPAAVDSFETLDYKI